MCDDSRDEIAGKHAEVVGWSMAGLIATRVLAAALVLVTLIARRIIRRAAVPPWDSLGRHVQATLEAWRNTSEEPTQGE